MIKQILKLLSIDDFYGKSEVIEIAKGRYAYPKTFKDVFKNFKRQMKWLKKR